MLGTMPDELVGQLDLALRLVVAAALGTVIGLEREIHDHPAGTRTHLLVALGAAVFTIAGAEGFGARANGAPPVDATRIAAQIVSGIGFLGAGAIIQSGTSVRGLTTAASLWATAAIGLAIGAREYTMAVVGTLLIVFSLGPMRRLAHAVRRRRPHEELRARLELDSLERLVEVSARLKPGGVRMDALESRKLPNGRYTVELRLLVATRKARTEVLALLSGLPGVDVMESAEPALDET